MVYSGLNQDHGLIHLPPRFLSQVSICHKLSIVSSNPSEYFLSPGSLMSSSVLIFASVIGVSILYLPYSLYISGIYLGVFYILFSMLANFFSCYCLIAVSEKTERITYYGLGSHLLGRKAGPVCEIALALSCFDKYLSYLLVLEYLPVAAFNTAGVENSFVNSREAWITMITCLMIFPIGFFTELSSLRYSTLISLISAIVVSFGIFYEVLTMRDNVSERISLSLSQGPYAYSDSYHYLYPFSRSLMSFCCQTNLLAIYDEMNFRNMRKGMMATGIGMGFVQILYLVLGISGYLLFFQEGLKDQILLGEYKSGDPVIVIVRSTSDFYS